MSLTEDQRWQKEELVNLKLVFTYYPAEGQK